MEMLDIEIYAINKVELLGKLEVIQRKLKYGLENFTIVNEYKLPNKIIGNMEMLNLNLNSLNKEVLLKELNAITQKIETNNPGFVMSKKDLYVSYRPKT